MTHEFGTLMTSLIQEIFPGGYPSDGEVLLMTCDQKSDLYSMQSKLIQLFRERANTIVSELQRKMQILNEESTISLSQASSMSKSVDSIRESAILPIKLPAVPPLKRSEKFRRDNGGGSKLPLIEPVNGHNKRKFPKKPFIQQQPCLRVKGPGIAKTSFH